MQKNTWLRFGAVALGAAVLAFSFTPVTEAGPKTLLCHVSPGGEDGVFSQIILVSDNAVTRHLDNHAGDFVYVFGVDGTDGQGDLFSDDACTAIL